MPTATPTADTGLRHTHLQVRETAGRFGEVVALDGSIWM
jgi:hypothetical protein